MDRVGFEEIPAPASPADYAQTLIRAARFPHLIGMQEDPEAVLEGLKIGLVGSGSVGRNLALHLARQLPHTLWLVDRSRFKTESLLTQAIDPRDLRHPKASSTGRLCRSISPRTRVFVFDGPVEHLDPTAFLEADLVVMATDNLAVEVEMASRCLRLRRPLIQASVHGETLVAQVRFFANADGQGPCPVCAFGEKERSLLHRQTRFSCEGAHARTPAPVASEEPTMSLSFLCSMAADLAMIQILRHLLRLGPSVLDTEIEYCGYTHRTAIAPLRRNPACRVDHVPLAEGVPPDPLGDCTLRELARMAHPAAGGGLNQIAWTLQDVAFVELGGCRAGHRQHIGRFLAAGESAGECPTCGAPVYAYPFYTHPTAPASILLPLVDRPLRELGAGSSQWVIVHAGEQAVLFRAPREDVHECT